MDGLTENLQAEIDRLKKENVALKKKANKAKKPPFPLEEKDLFIIQYNFANGDKPCLIQEKDGNWKGESWWIDGGHEKKAIVCEHEDGIECDTASGKGMTTMSQICISVPKQKK